MTDQAKKIWSALWVPWQNWDYIIRVYDWNISFIRMWSETISISEPLWKWRWSKDNPIIFNQFEQWESFIDAFKWWSWRLFYQSLDPVKHPWLIIDSKGKIFALWNLNFHWLIELPIVIEDQWSNTYTSSIWVYIQRQEFEVWLQAKLVNTWCNAWQAIVEYAIETLWWAKAVRVTDNLWWPATIISTEGLYTREYNSIPKPLYITIQDLENENNKTTINCWIRSCNVNPWAVQNITKFWTNSVKRDPPISWYGPFTYTILRWTYIVWKWLSDNMFTFVWQPQGQQEYTIFATNDIGEGTRTSFNFIID